MSAMIKPTPPPVRSAVERTREILKEQLQELEIAAQALRNALREMDAGTEGQVLTMRRASGPYSGMDLGPASRSYLAEVGQPVTANELAQAVVDRGIWPEQSAERALTSAKAMLKILVKDPKDRAEKQPTKTFVRVIKQIGDLVGLEEWPANRFK